MKLNIRSTPCVLACSCLLLGVFMVMAVPGLAADRPDRPEKIQFPDQPFHPPKPERIEMANGLIVYLLPDRSIPLVRAMGLIHAGSLCEKPEESGLAGLTASLLRLGGSTVTSATEMNRALEFAGASLESAGSRDYASLSMRVLSQDLDLGIRLLSEILVSPAFPPDKIDQRRAEALDTLRRQEDDPLEVTRREFRKLMYGEHPYGRDPLGDEQTLPKFTREDLLQWHKRFIHPDRMILALSGDFERQQILALLEKYLGGWPKGNVPVEYPEVKPSPAAGKSYFIRKDLNQSTIRLGHLGIARNNPDKVTIEVLNFILGGGSFSSRLFNRVRSDSGYAYRVVSDFEESLLTGQFVVVLQTQSANAVKAEKLTRDIVKEIARADDITQEELDLAKQSRMNDFVFEFETPSDTCNLSAQVEYFRVPQDYLEKYRERVAALTLEDLKKAAAKYLKPDQLTLLVLGNSDVEKELSTSGPLEMIETREKKAKSK